ncbi:MAG TPA: hypothetical protein VK574_12020 [Terracidiphilus sp.]|nr:hypothetical protein [Terracidiphilus sp.]
MKFALAILVLVVFALSFVADYKWRRWMNNAAPITTQHKLPAQTISTNPRNPRKLPAPARTRIRRAMPRLPK